MSFQPPDARFASVLRARRREQSSSIPAIGTRFLVGATAAVGVLIVASIVFMRSWLVLGAVLLGILQPCVVLLWLVRHRSLRGFAVAGAATLGMWVSAFFLGALLAKQRDAVSRARGERLVERIESYRLRHGAWPGSKEELAGDGTGEVPRPLLIAVDFQFWVQDGGLHVSFPTLAFMEWTRLPDGRWVCGD